MQSCQIRFRVAKSRKQNTLRQQICKFANFMNSDSDLQKAKNALSADLQIIRLEINELTSSADMDCC